MGFIHNTQSRRSNRGGRVTNRSLSEAKISILLVLLLCIARVGFSSENAVHYQAPGTKSMISRLQQWTKDFGDRSPWSNLSKIRELKASIPNTPNGQDRIFLQMQLA